MQIMFFSNKSLDKRVTRSLTVFSVGAVFSALVLASCGSRHPENTKSASSEDQISIPRQGLSEAEVVSEHFTDRNQVIESQDLTRIECCESKGFPLTAPQAKFSKFRVKYLNTCGTANSVSSLGLETDQQRRALVFGAVHTVSLFGQGSLTLKDIPRSGDATPPDSPCRLYVEVLSIEAVDELYSGQ